MGRFYGTKNCSKKSLNELLSVNFRSLSVFFLCKRLQVLAPSPDQQTSDSYASSRGRLDSCMWLIPIFFQDYMSPVIISTGLQEV